MRIEYLYRVRFEGGTLHGLVSDTDPLAREMLAPDAAGNMQTYRREKRPDGSYVYVFAPDGAT